MDIFSFGPDYLDNVGKMTEWPQYPIQMTDEQYKKAIDAAHAAGVAAGWAAGIEQAAQCIEAELEDGGGHSCDWRANAARIRALTPAAPAQPAGGGAVDSVG